MFLTVCGLGSVAEIGSSTASPTALARVRMVRFQYGGLNRTRQDEMKTIFHVDLQLKLIGEEFAFR